MGRRKLIEVYEEITTTCNWVVPAGCKSVDAFVVGGGQNGYSGKTGAIRSNGGNGGACKTYSDIGVTPGEVIPIVIGGIAATSYFKNTTYQALGAQGVSGGSANSQTTFHGNPGRNGVYAFGNSIKFPKPFGASGGAGGSRRDGNEGKNDVYNGGSGGYYGGGAGGQVYGIVLKPGANATWYGAGGGGGSSKTIGGNDGGSGYQGIVILHYYKYK